METIKMYLHNMFQNLPDTPEVQRAREELLQMMEDKYQELKEEGKSENEAVGIVIAEFGNLDEIAEDLGIKNVINEEKNVEDPSAFSKEEPKVQKGSGVVARMLDLTEAQEFLKAYGARALFVALGVFLCIFCPVPTVIFFTFAEAGILSFGIAEAIGICLMFLCIAAGVVLFILSGTIVKVWREEPLMLEENAYFTLKNEKQQIQGKMGILCALGVGLCVLSILPAIVADALALGETTIEDLSGAALLIFVAAGVFLIVYSSMKKKSYQILFGEKSDVEKKSNKKNQKNPIVAMYWQAVTCIYLCWSFLTFNWHITWLIWPVAVFIFSILKYVLHIEEDE